jgi:hypothetical protein
MEIYRRARPGFDGFQGVRSREPQASLGGEPTVLAGYPRSEALRGQPEHLHAGGYAGDSRRRDEEERGEARVLGRPATGKRSE